MKILIADDDVEYRQSLEEILAGRGHTIITADDGEAAILSYRENKKIDLVITDYNMPKENGLVVIQEIQEIEPKARIWLVSNAMNNEIKNLAIKLGADKAMQKTELEKELRNFL
jgi:DNA-binding response OmpR family regulator